MNELEAALDWFWGMLQGDFNEDQTTSQIVVGTVISMIPVIDQIADIRDVIANLMNIRKEPTDVWKWVLLVITLIGLIPTLGSVLKGVFKLVFKFAKGGGKDAAKALESVLAVLRGAGKGDPVAFLRKLPYDQYTRMVTARFDEFMNGFRVGIQKARSYMSSKWLNWAMGETSKKLHLVELEMQRLQKLGHDMIPDAMHALKAKVDELLGEVKPAKIEGTTDKGNTLAHSSKPLMRIEYELAVARIKDGVESMRKAGKSESEVAQWAQGQRRELGVRFKNKTDPDLLPIIYKRNIEKYGDPLGPKYEDFKRGYFVRKDGTKVPVTRDGLPKSDKDIADGAYKAGGNDLPWDKILEYGREKKTGDPAKAKRLLEEIDALVNPAPKK